tara:strand:+ start:881 stop:1387 length:507 start_codon:yes stop_codon:yes gene_type:complete
MKYYKTVSQRNENVLILEVDDKNGGGVLFDLVNLINRELESGERFNEAFEISANEYQGLVITYFIKLGDRLSTYDHKIEFDLQDYKAQLTNNAEVPSKMFDPKVSFELIHKDVQVGGFSERTTLELINFINDVKNSGKHMLIKNIDGEITFMVDSQTVFESSFEFKEI